MPPLKGRSEVEPSELPNRVDHWQHFKTGDFNQKWNLSKSIVREGKCAIAPLLEILSDPTIDAETHWFTIRALGNFPEPEVITTLATQISDTSCYINHTPDQATELSTFTIETLAAMGPLAIEVLSQLLQNPQQRLSAVKALNQVRSSGVIPAMIDMANDEEAQVRYYAIDALGSFHSAVVTPVLLAALKDPSANVRKSAVMALGRRRDLPAHYQLSQQLQPLLWDLDLTVSCQTALALGRLAASDTLDALQRVLLSPHTPIALRLDTVRSLAWYCDRSSDTQKQATQQAFAILTHAMIQLRDGQNTDNDQTNKQVEENTNNTTDSPQLVYSEENVQVLITIVRELGSLHHPSMANHATQSLLECLDSSLPATVIQAIIMALASLDQPQAFDALLPMLNHPADIIPIHAISALKRLDPDQSLHRVTTYLDHFPEHQTTILNLW